MCAFNPREQARLGHARFDAIASLNSALTRAAPWDSITDFITHPSYCGFPIFPKQATLFKLMFLETEQMTAYDLDVIEDWRKGFTQFRNVYGVQPDIWQRVEYLKERGYRRFSHIQNVLGRRASKGVIGGVLGCEQCAYLHSLDDPQAYYGVVSNKDVYLNIGATSQTTAKRQLFADVRDMVERCRYFKPKDRPSWIAESKPDILRIRTAADERHIAELLADGVPVDHQIASLVCVALSASSVAGRGSTSHTNMYDEFAFHVQTGSAKSDTEIYKDWQPNLGQFDKDSLTYIPSSPATKAGYFYVLYEMGRVLMSTYTDTAGVSEDARQQLTNITGGSTAVEVEADPSWLVFQGPSWGLYEDWEQTPTILGLGYAFKKAPEPDLSSERQIRERMRDPDKFKVEKMGQFAEVEGAYLDPDKVDKMFVMPDWREPLQPQAYGAFAKSYRMHCDPGRTGANFACAIGHLENAPCDVCGTLVPYGADIRHQCSGNGHIWPHVVFDLLKVWRPMDYPEDPETHKRTIDYVEVHRDLEDILGRFESTSRCSFDQWNSASFLSSLRRQFSPAITISVVDFNERANQSRFEKFKSALNLEWIHSYKDSFYTDNLSCLLELELKFLAEKNGKVVCQEVGPVITKDLADCVMVVTVDLLKDALDRYSGASMTKGQYGSTDIAGLKSGREFERQQGATAIHDPSLRERNLNAKQILEDARKSRQRSRLQGRGSIGYAQDRTRSIHVREPKLRK